MTGTSLDDLHRQWLGRPGYKEAYDALEPEFALASALIKARASAGLTQAQRKRCSLITLSWGHEQVRIASRGGQGCLEFRGAQA